MNYEFSLNAIQILVVKMAENRLNSSDPKAFQITDHKTTYIF